MYMYIYIYAWLILIMYLYVSVYDVYAIPVDKFDILEDSTAC